MCEGFNLDGRPTKTFRELGEVFDQRYLRSLDGGKSCPPDRRSAKRNPGNRDGLDRVWHCSLAIRAGDGILTDQQWESLVVDYLQRLNILDEYGEGATWLAVRHGLSKNGNDHVHVVVQLATDNGWINPYNDRVHAQRACRSMERERPELTSLEMFTDRDHIRYSYREWREWAEWKARQDYQGTVPWERVDADTRMRLMAGVMASTMPRYAVGRLVRVYFVNSACAVLPWES